VKTLHKVCVLGAGTMGAGIAQWFAQSGVSAELSDVDIDACTKALNNIHASWSKLESKGKFTAKQVKNFKENLTVCQSDNFSKDADLCIEAIVESLEIKVSVFKKLHNHFNENTVLASNTSSIPIDAMAKELPKSRRSQFVGLHFFNPATIMKLVEVIGGHYSDKDLCKSLASWFLSKGKKPARCSDGPGFIVNRVARNYYGEPFRIIKTENKDKIEEIDQVMREVGGFRMGPFELMDLIGIDVNYSVSESVWRSFYNEERFAPHMIQKELVQSGRCGRKTGEGFYKYE
jgi:3-hydroxybutyryl-CoA dehydrogenase